MNINIFASLQNIHWLDHLQSWWYRRPVTPERWISKKIELVSFERLRKLGIPEHPDNEDLFWNLFNSKILHQHLQHLDLNLVVSARS